MTARLDQFLVAVRTWMAQTGRPVSIDTVGDAELPAMVITVWGPSDPELSNLDGVTHTRRVGLSLTSVGRNTTDALWLHAKAMVLLTADPPTNLGVQFCSITPDSGAALEPDEGRMLATHRVACAYR